MPKKTQKNKQKQNKKQTKKKILARKFQAYFGWVVTNCGGASRTAFHETLRDIPVRVRRTSPFRLQISRVVSRDFWRKQSAKVPSPARSTCVGNFSNITSHFREAFPPSKLSSFFYHIFECLSNKFLFRCCRSRCEECYKMRCGME